MHFEKVELIGFKSFAERTVLQFEPGVTTVVGPNGCGKSNIADAIRWALGEQSTKSLRASKMEDVIFNGTHTKEPINFAEVSVTFSNQDRSLPIDYDQVTISRRLYRSGDTEYLLNRTPVRLKDISELLMGTGIGTESYSIIEQGKMDLVLSSRAEDRRFVFEEASGITKYKSKKREAMRKLDDTENNLVRINDIIQEVKRQINSIERQARKAERYKVEFDKLKAFEMRLSSFEYKNLKNREKTSSVERDDLKAREEELTQEIARVNEKLGEFRAQLDEISVRSTECSGRYVETAATIDKNKHRIQVDNERVEEAKNLYAAISGEITSIGERIASQEELVRNISEEFEKVKTESSNNALMFETRNLRLKELSGEIEALEDGIKSGKARAVELLREETRIKNELIKLGSEIQNRKSRMRRLGMEKENTAEELNAQEDALRKVAEACTVSERRVSDVAREVESKKARFETIAQEVKTLEEEIARQRNTITGLRSKQEFIEDLARRREGFGAAVKYILNKYEQDPTRFRKVYGVVADMLSIESGYRGAVEAALGENARTIVVETDADIAKAIAALEGDKAGRAGFVSMERIRQTPGVDPSTRSTGMPVGLHIPADDADTESRLLHYVTTAPEHEPVAKYFLGGVRMAGSVEELLQSSGESPQGRLVTTSGALLDENKVSGGGTGEQGDLSIVGRHDRINSLRLEIESLAFKIEDLQKKKNDDANTMSGLKAATETEERNLRDEQINFANADTRKRSIEEAANKLRDEIAVVDLELEEVSQAVDEMTKRGEELNTSLNGFENENTALRASTEAKQGELEKKRQEKESVLLEETSLKTKIDSSRRELERFVRNTEKEASFLTELKDSLASRVVSREGLTARSETLKTEVEQLTRQNEELERGSYGLREELDRIGREKSDTTDKMSIDELQLKEKETELENSKNQIRDFELKKMEIDYKMSSIRERIQQAYKADIDTAHVDYDEHEDWDGMRAQIEEMRSNLDDMGQVNLVAIEEHKELEERYAFLVHQRQDLVNAKDSLMKAIQKINKTTKELFLEAFHKIQVEFKNYFRLLFGGGQAELILLDEQDVLEAGVEIVARPPGKKLQSIMLLSGGEKALTAISLLFAIFKVKPSPFCILDEIDAPLDESNIDRFSKVLQDFVKMSQFIIITHNKKTIELADVMYGITMQEQGVSKIVSVKFLETAKGAEGQRKAVAA
ncbi:MAG: chromosome segregation protein SMC [Candidatus Omnitrophota bacterium]